LRFRPAQTYTVLYTFRRSPFAAGPLWGVIQDLQGNLYGTIVGGGSAGNGTAYQPDPTTDDFVYYSLQSGNDYGQFAASLIRDANRNFFGNTYHGGPVFGTVYELTAARVERRFYMRLRARPMGHIPVSFVGRRF
jgi:hypothetical protein